MTNLLRFPTAAPSIAAVGLEMPANAKTAGAVKTIVVATLPGFPR